MEFQGKPLNNLLTGGKLIEHEQGYRKNLCNKESCHYK